MDIVLADLTIDGSEVKALMHAPKNGFFYVIDRRTGTDLRGAVRGDDLGVEGRPRDGPSHRSARRALRIGIRGRDTGSVRRTQLAVDVVQSRNGLVYIPTIHQRTSLPTRT